MHSGMWNVELWNCGIVELWNCGISHFIFHGDRMNIDISIVGLSIVESREGERERGRGRSGEPGGEAEAGETREQANFNQPVGCFDFIARVLLGLGLSE